MSSPEQATDVGTFRAKCLYLFLTSQYSGENFFLFLFLYFFIFFCGIGSVRHSKSIELIYVEVPYFSCCEVGSHSMWPTSLELAIRTAL